MDSSDKKILKYLQQNSNFSIKEIASNVGLSITPVYERIRKLEKEGFIKNYSAILDPVKLGLKITIIVNITIKEHNHAKRNEFVKSILSFDEICELYHTSGAYDFMVKIRMSSIEEYKDFLITKLSSIPNINDIESQIVLEEMKFTTEIILD